MRKVQYMLTSKVGFGTTRPALKWGRCTCLIHCQYFHKQTRPIASYTTLLTGIKILTGNNVTTGIDIMIGTDVESPYR